MLKWLNFGVITQYTAENAYKAALKLIREAKSMITMIGAENNRYFLNDKQVLDALASAAERGVHIRIASCVNENNKRPINRLKSKTGRQTFVQLEKRPVRFMMSIDSKHIRLESTESLGSKTPAIVLLDSPSSAKVIEDEFDELFARKRY